MLRAFPDWPAVLRHVRDGRPIWYHAPLDYRPVPVRAKLTTTSQRVRVSPCLASDADAFTADAGHLERFRYQDQDDSPRPLWPYVLPDLTVVQVDDSAAKGALTIDYTLLGGRIVEAARMQPHPFIPGHPESVRGPEACHRCAASREHAVHAQYAGMVGPEIAHQLSPAEIQRRHLDQFGRAAQDQERSDHIELTLRVLGVQLAELCARYGAAAVLEALADHFTQRAADGGSGEATGAYGALALAIEEARGYALRYQL